MEIILLCSSITVSFSLWLSIEFYDNFTIMIAPGVIVDLIHHQKHFICEGIWNLFPSKTKKTACFIEADLKMNKKINIQGCLKVMSFMNFVDANWKRGEHLWCTLTSLDLFSIELNLNFKNIECNLTLKKSVALRYSFAVLIYVKKGIV